MLYGLDLFSGIGGISEALKDYVRPICYCENDPYAAGVLFSRMLDGAIPKAPIFPDVRNLNKRILKADIDIIYGGFPCQDISVAGRGKGLGGEQSSLFFEVVRLVRELRPTFIFLENSPAITGRGLSEVTAKISAMGYDCRWTVLSAAETGAPHLRERWWLLAYADSERGRKKQISFSGGEGTANVIDTMCESLEGQRSSSNWWAVEPDVGRVVHGLPYRVDRIRCLGNSVVPQCAETAFKELAGIKD